MDQTLVFYTLREVLSYVNDHLTIIQENFNLNPIGVQPCQPPKFKKPKHNVTLYLVDKICNKKQVQSFLDELICPICYEIVADPQSCKKCEKSFCTLCIKNWEYKNKYSCPCCRQYLQIQKPSKYLKILLDKLIFSCINEERGCDKLSIYSELEHHEIFCDYKILKCPNQNCFAEFLQKEEKKHLMQCSYEPVMCEGCELYFLRKDFDFHSESCIYLMNRCQFCNHFMHWDKFILHFKDCKKIFEKNTRRTQKKEHPEIFDEYIKEQKSIKQFSSSPGYNKKNKSNYR